LPETPTDEKSQKPADQNKGAEQPNAAEQPVVPPQPAQQSRPAEQPAVPGPVPNGASYFPPGVPTSAYPPVSANVPAASPVYTVPRPYSPTRQPVFVRNASRPTNPQQLQWQQAATPRENNLIGPIGYDLQQ
jgi:hypothetical protein